jgi:uncharacterized protein YjbJ (UPF0337 family)
MDRDRVKGVADQTKGAIKENVGKAIGDEKLETEGKVDKVAGKIESAVGSAKDKMRDLRDWK